MTIYRYDKPIICEYLKIGITDSVLYEYKNERLVIKNEVWRKNNIKRLVINDKTYYISDTLANLITKSIQPNQCNNFVILPLESEDKYKIIRD